jgi:SAM-dependent methyltransferase
LVDTCHELVPSTRLDLLSTGQIDALGAFIERYLKACPDAKLLSAGFYTYHPVAENGQNVFLVLDPGGQVRGFAPVFPEPVGEGSAPTDPHHIWAILLARLGWDGRCQALDIGCGSGALSIRLAKMFPGANVTGVDSWGAQWEYSKVLCEHNASLEGVGERMTFQRASASSLPFPDESFDVVVSNLVFHEVRDAPDKKALVREALRVVRKGGRFALQDLFLMKQVYGNVDDLLRTIRGWGVTKVEFVETRKAPFIPRVLKLPFMVGTLGLIVGEK